MEPRVVEKVIEVPEVFKSRVSGSLRDRLMGEATAFGDVDQPVTAGFGNPYLLGIVVVLVLGIASYYSLGLDKVTEKTTKMTNKEAMERMIATQNAMSGGM